MKLLKIIEEYLFFLGLFLLPLVFIPVFPNAFETPKLLLLVIVSALILLIKLIKIVISKSFQFSSNKYDLILISISIVYIASSLLMTSNKVEAFFLPGTASLIILSSIFYFFANQLEDKERNNLVYVLLSSSLVLSVLLIFSFLKVFRFLPVSTFGSLITSAIFLLAMLPFVVYDLFNKNSILKKILMSFVGLLLLVGIAISTYQMMPSKTTSFKNLPYQTGWQIATDSIKESPFLGVGPGNYIDAFNKFRPISFNLTPEWNLKYVSSSSLLLTVLTEGGLLATFLFLVLFFLILKSIKFDNPYYVSLLILILGLIIFPVLFSFLPIVFVLVSLFSKNVKRVNNNFVSNLPSFLISVPLFLSLVTVGYLFTRATLAEIYFGRSIKEASSGTAIKTYEYINKSITLNPYSDRYHLYAANINYALGNNISQKKELTDQEKETITKLIQQSIVEAKAGVTLNPQRSGNWESLSSIYVAIIPFAKGSDLYAVQSLSQAIFLDPLNPVLRVRLGGIYYARKEYEEAIDIFKLAVLAKNDYPNAHYNLSLAYKEKGDLIRAKDEMNIVLKLIGESSKDYDTALKELGKIEELTKPEAIPEPAIEPQIELPIDNQNNEG